MNKNFVLYPLAALLLLLGGCVEMDIQPTDMVIEYQFLDSSDEIYEACGRQPAEACARIVGTTCLITLPKSYWQQHLAHEMKHCFGATDAPKIAMNDL